MIDLAATDTVYNGKGKTLQRIFEVKYCYSCNTCWEPSISRYSDIPDYYPHLPKLGIPKQVCPMCKSRNNKEH